MDLSLGVEFDYIFVSAQRRRGEMEENMKNSRRLYGFYKYKRQIERDEEIAEELQDRNKSDRGAESQDS